MLWTFHDSSAVTACSWHTARPHDQIAYPPDVLADDGLALIGRLGLGAGEYDLGGYSLGGRIVVADGTALPTDSAAAQIARWVAELGADPRALLHVLDSLVRRRRASRCAARRALGPRARKPRGRVRSA
jgi:hypothetical protein